MSAIIRSTHAVAHPDGGKAQTMIEVTTRPNAEQNRALVLLKDIARM